MTEREQQSLPRRPKSRAGLLARRLVLCLLAGVVATLAVSWGLALLRPHTGRSTNTRQLRLDDELVYRHLRRLDFNGMSRLYWSVRNDQRVAVAPDGENVIPDWSGLAQAAMDPERLGADSLLIEVGFGFPRVAMAYEYERLGTNWTDPRSPVRGGIDVGDRKTAGRIEVLALPLRPSWSGWLVNTVFYTAAGLVMLYAVDGIYAIFTERRRRRREGRCEDCGYDLRGSPDRVCPECGRAAWPASSG